MEVSAYCATFAIKVHLFVPRNGVVQRHTVWIVTQDSKTNNSWCGQFFETCFLHERSNSVSYTPPQKPLPGVNRIYATRQNGQWNPKSSICYPGKKDTEFRSRSNLESGPVVQEFMSDTPVPRKLLQGPAPSLSWMIARARETLRQFNKFYVKLILSPISFICKSASAFPTASSTGW